MLKRGDVLQPVFDYLEKEEGYEVLNRWTKQYAHNPQDKKVTRSLIAIHPQKGRLLIDAYGETAWPVSSRTGDKDRVMDEGETFTCVSRGIHGAACRLFSRDQEEKKDTIVLCFPHTHSFWKYLRPVKDALDRLEIIVFLVRGDQTVVKL